MKIIIPMAGRGSRFQNIGLTCAKHEIVAQGKTLFEWSMLSLSDFFEHDFIFILRQGMSLEPLKVQCQQLGIVSFQFIVLEVVTQGQASTVMQVQALLKPDDAVVVYNIDTYVEEGALRIANITPQAAGYVPAFVAEGDQWSFVKTDPKQPAVVTQITEKVRISNLGTLGLYYFKHWRDFERIYTTHKANIIQNYRETYIAPMYQYLIDEGKRVETSLVPVEAIHVLGTPDDLRKFCPNYLLEN